MQLKTPSNRDIKAVLSYIPQFQKGFIALACLIGLLLALIPSAAPALSGGGREWGTILPGGHLQNSSATLGDIVSNTPRSVVQSTDLNNQSQSAQIIQLSGSHVYEAATTLEDLDGDGKLEIIVGGRTLNGDGSLGCNGMVYVIRSDGSFLWEKMVRADVNSSAGVADLNGDGYKDIVVGMGAWNAGGENQINECGQGDANAAGNGGVVALDGRNGTQLWLFNTQDWGEWASGPNGVLDGVYSSPAIGDVNGDGEPEVAFTSWDNCIYLLDRQGNPLWGKIPFDYYNPNNGVTFCGETGFLNHDTNWSSPALVDLTGDGKLEIIVGGDISCDVLGDLDLCNAYQEDNGGFVWVIRYDGEPLARKWFDQAIFSSPAVADLDNDGQLEIAVGTGLGFAGTGYYVTAMHLDTSLPFTEALVVDWQTPVIGRSIASPAIADLNEDGILDVVLTVRVGDWGTPFGAAPDNGSYIYAFSGNSGSILWQTHTCNNDSIGRSFPHNSSPILADITGDARPEVLFAHGWEVGVLNPDGTYYSQVNTSNGCTNTSGDVLYTSNGSFQSTVAAGDLDGDGMLEIVAAGRWNENIGSLQGAVYVWAGHPSRGYHWPQFHRDAAHNGLYTASPISDPQIPASVSILHEVGNDSSAIRTLRLSNSGGAPFNFEMTNLPTRVQLSRTSGQVPANGTLSLTMTVNTAGLGERTYKLGLLDVYDSDTNLLSGSISVSVVIGELNYFYLPITRR